jgi:hypothetical protein
MSKMSATTIKAIEKSIIAVVKVLDKYRFGGCMFVVLAISITGLRHVQIVIP